METQKLKDMGTWGHREDLVNREDPEKGPGTRCRAPAPKPTLNYNNYGTSRPRSRPSSGAAAMDSVQLKMFYGGSEGHRAWGQQDGDPTGVLVQPCIERRWRWENLCGPVPCVIHMSLSLVHPSPCPYSQCIHVPIPNAATCMPL